MLTRSVYVLGGIALSILLVAGVAIFNHYWGDASEAPVKVYKTATPAQRVETAESSDTPAVVFQPESEAVDILLDEEFETPEADETEATREASQPEFDDASEPLPATNVEETPQEDSRVIVLQEVFPEFDRLLEESLQLADEMKGATPDNFADFAAKGEALESEIQGHCQRIADEFPGAVTFIAIQGQQWAYDVDFQMVHDSIQGPIPSELDGYFRHTSMREMFGLPEIPPDQLQQMQ